MPHVTTLPRPADVGTGDDVDHLYCCDVNVAMCGIDLSEVPEGRQFPDVCPLCTLAESACPRCGQ